MSAARFRACLNSRSGGNRQLLLRRHTFVRQPPAAHRATGTGRGRRSRSSATPRIHGLRLLQRLNHPRAERNTGETDVVESLTKPDRGSPLVRDSPEPPAAPHPHRRSSTLSALLLLALALNSRFGWSWTYSTADLVIAAAAIRQRKSKPGARTPANPNQPHPTHHRQVADAAGLFATPPHLTDRVRDCRGQCWKPPNGDPRNHIAPQTPGTHAAASPPSPETHRAATLQRRRFAPTPIRASTGPLAAGPISTAYRGHDQGAVPQRPSPGRWLGCGCLGRADVVSFFPAVHLTGVGSWLRRAAVACMERGSDDTAYPRWWPGARPRC